MIGRQKSPQTYATLDLAIAAAVAANEPVWASVSGTVYFITAQGKANTY
jgi:hypothetical protein